MFNLPFPEWLRSVHHDGSALYVSNPLPAIGETITIRLRASEHAPLKRVLLRTFPDGEQALTPMHPAQHQSPARWWQLYLTIRQPYEHYRFLLEAEDGAWWYSAAGPSLIDPLDGSDFQLVANYRAPAWVHQAVFYQIFVDRFSNGDPGNDPRPEEFEYRGKRPRTFGWEQPPDDKTHFSLAFYGGDLQGVQQRLEYLAELGVNAIYFNPVFSAFSNHKYDVADYYHVDEHFGGDNALIALRQALSARNMRYILDVVPNHCGYWNTWFQAARKDPHSPEAGFFTFDRYPDDYASWLGVWSLPKLNYASQELRQRMYAAPDAIFRRWLQSPYGADGWRIDVANMLARQGPSQHNWEIATAMRAAVKQTRSDAYLIGENFFDASAQLQGDMWDAVMNYAGFTMPLWHWLRGYMQGAWGMRETVRGADQWPTAALEAAWRVRRAAIPWAIQIQQYNQLDSHDTERIRTIVGGNEALHRLAVILQFTYPGVPGIYYGDEIGLVDDPKLGSRNCMVWDETRWNKGMHSLYRNLAFLRRSSPALQEGGFQVLAIEHDLLAYQRETSEERWLVLAQRNNTPRPAAPMPVWHGGIPDGVRFREHFSGQTAHVQNGALQVPELPQGATLWQQV